MEFTTSGMIFMALGWGFVITLTIFSIAKVLRTKDDFKEDQ